MIDIEKKTKVWDESGDIRTFYPDTPSDELEWHVDFEDRVVTVIKSGGWLLQRDNQIPKSLIDGESFLIKKFNWHRVIKGSEELVIHIKKIS